MDNKNRENERLPIDKKNGEIIKNDDTAEYAFKWDTEPTKKAREKSAFPTGIMVLCIILLAAFSVFAVYSVRTGAEQLETSPPDQIETSLPDDVKTIYVKDGSLAEGLLTPQEIYTSTIDSVVSIHATAKGKEGIGTGFIWSADGYIATVYHVIDGMEKISIITSDGKEYSASIVGSNELCDLAMLKIEATGMPAVTLGDSSSLLVGEELVAIGTPASLDFAGTMTRGDVSYNDRVVHIYDEESGSLKKKMTLIQTSAMLNPGNSGGPVFDVYGKVVGIVTMKLGAGFDGIGFAIPIDTAAPILEDMIKGVESSTDKLSSVARYAARLGIAGQNFSGDVGGKTLLGVTIVEFKPTDCDAAQKLRIGDVIVSVNGNAISDTSSLAKALCNYDPGDTVTVTVYRSGQLLSFSVKLIK